MDSYQDYNTLNRKESVYDNEKQTGCFYNRFYNYKSIIVIVIGFFLSSFQAFFQIQSNIREDTNCLLLTMKDSVIKEVS